MLNLHLADFSKPERALYKKVRSESKCRGCGVVEFAAEHGMTWKLEKMYPPKDQVAA